MLGEFGVVGAFIAFGLIFGQLGQVFGWSSTVTLAIIVILTIAYGIYCQSIGRGILIFLCLTCLLIQPTLSLKLEICSAKTIEWSDFDIPLSELKGERILGSM